MHIENKILRKAANSAVSSITALTLFSGSAATISPSNAIAEAVASPREDVSLGATQSPKLSLLVATLHNRIQARLGIAHESSASTNVDR